MCPQRPLSDDAVVVHAADLFYMGLVQFPQHYERGLKTGKQPQSKTSGQDIKMPEAMSRRFQERFKNRSKLTHQREIGNEQLRVLDLNRELGLGYTLA